MLEPGNLIPGPPTDLGLPEIGTSSAQVGGATVWERYFGGALGGLGETAGVAAFGPGSRLL